MKKISLLLTTTLLLISVPSFSAYSADQKAVTPVKDNYVSIHANTAKYKTQNIIQVLNELKMFKTFLAALKVSGLEQMFIKAGTFTVFAPNDAAFAKIPKADFDALMKNKTMLRKILLYHVLIGIEMSKDIVKRKSLKTVEGSTIKITQKGKRIIINDSDFLNGDIKTKNGVIHIVDTCIILKK